MNASNRRTFLKRSAVAATGIAILRGNRAAYAQTRVANETDNETIQRARRMALSVLKPTEKQLEHGLALHRESLVFDSYGFSPRCAIDGERMRRAIEVHASAAELDDMREDMMMTRCVTDAAEREEFKQAWEAAGVTCIFQNAGQEGQDPMRLIKRLARFTYVTDMLSDFIVKAATPDDIEKARAAGKRCLYLTGNGVPLTQDWISVADEFRYIRIFFQLGIRMMHMTYNRRNMIGDGCAEPSNAGLSDFGRSAVKELNRVGVIPDVAHSGWQTSLETAQESGRPAVASHSACADVHRHIRGKPDDVIRAIADTGGYVGIACIPSFLGGAGDIGIMLNHIEHIARNFGPRHVAIGTDVAYTSRNASGENRKAGSRPRSRTAFRYLWPPGSLKPNPQASMTMAWTNWPLFTVGLVQRGIKDDDIRKIIGGNVMRVSRAALA